MLTVDGGFENSKLASLLTLPSRFWSLGPALMQTALDTGRRRAGMEEALANYDATVAAYRQTVLTACRDVEDNLAVLRVLADEAMQQADAAASSERLLALANNRYAAGVAAYLEVISAQAATLANHRAAVEIFTRRMIASTLLIKGLGGGWRGAGRTATNAALQPPPPP
jgi:outer membrane protein TolC